jgi:hypothetical protein
MLLQRSAAFRAAFLRTRNKRDTIGYGASVAAQRSRSTGIQHGGATLIAVGACGASQIAKANGNISVRAPRPTTHRTLLETKSDNSADKMVGC